MSESIQKIRDDRASMAKAVNDLVNNFPDDKEWTNEHQEQYDNYVANVEKLDKKIERHEKAMELSAANMQRTVDISEQNGISLDEAENKRAQVKSATANWLRGGVSNLTDDQRKLLNKRLSSPQNALSTGVGAEGGYLTDDEFVPTLLEAMKDYGGMREMANVIRTATGSQMTWPTTNATSEEGEIVGENVEVSTQDTSFGVKNMNTYKYSSKAVPVPFELLQDSQIDIEGYVRGLLSQRLGRITERHFTVGTGTGQPFGIITNAGVGVVAGSATSITFDDLINLEHSVDPIYRKSGAAGYQFHDSTLRELRKLKDNDGRPIWLPGYTSGSPNTINGFQYRVNQNIDTMEANAKPVAFGDFSKYIIRDVMQILLFRMTDSKYTEKGQVGFLAFMRSGGDLIDVGGAVKVLQNAA